MELFLKNWIYMAMRVFLDAFIFSNSPQIEKQIASKIMTHLGIFYDSTFDDNFLEWKTRLVPLFISRCELLCFTQDLDNSQDYLFHYLGVCLYGIAELLVPCFITEEDENYPKKRRM
eukprot:TRINITY_DN1280_c1_g1_i14.p1 TRINITY_DN1280_c1_g1~~TRINITY_DN1280_c1_g1_i14.p1  ORF type:complete len:117 (-),score=26.54 TRINITY_DN1280_c1_g1_i14:133-483(-)